MCVPGQKAGIGTPDCQKGCAWVFPNVAPGPYLLPGSTQDPSMPEKAIYKALLIALAH